MRIDLDKPQGLVCFPSFHTVLVIMFCYALRGTWLFWPAAVLGGLTMPSLPPIGGHYLIDIPAGAALALLAILVVRRWSPERAALRIEKTPAPAPWREPAHERVEDAQAR